MQREFTDSVVFLGTAPFTVAQFAEALDAFTAEKGLAKARILDFSDGGNMP